MKKSLASIIFLATAIPLFAGEKIEFKFKKGDNYRMLSTVEEDVRVNGRLNHHAQIVSRVTLSVKDVNSDGSGVLDGTYMTSESSTASNGTRLSWGEETKSSFTRAKNGKMTISDEYFMPIVRNLPIFPDSEVNIGDAWKEDGYEAQDLRREPFFAEKPVKVPFSATYEYLRDEEGLTSDSKREKKIFKVIEAKYTLAYQNPQPSSAMSDYPYSTMGYSNRLIYWDPEKGQIDHYTEDFRIMIETALGNQFDFSGRTKVEITEFKRTGTEEHVKEVQKQVEKMGLENVSVTKSEKGLTISIENIQFEPDSAVLRNGEKSKLQKIAGILNAYPDNDLLISGHTALAGTEKARQQLSEERADSVAEYLIRLGVKDKFHIFTQGFGSKVPIASNRTEEGKAKNRRVEITILDK